jgi:nitrate reductase gamma subunit
VPLAHGGATDVASSLLAWRAGPSLPSREVSPSLGTASRHFGRIRLAIIAIAALAAFSAACVAFAVWLIVATSTSVASVASVAFVGASCTFLAVAIAVVTIIAILSLSCRRRCDPRCDCRLAVARQFIDIVVVVIVATFVVVDPLDRRFRRRSSRSTLSPSSLLAIDVRRRRSLRSTLAIVALVIVALAIVALAIVASPASKN